jgi:hypothetical protein
VNELARRGGQPTFGQVIARPETAGSATVVSSRGTTYTVTSKVTDSGPVIIARPRRSEIRVHEDCWGDDITCQRTRAGGIYNGAPSIYDWFDANGD